jgi:hypothetical protein
MERGGRLEGRKAGRCQRTQCSAIAPPHCWGRNGGQLLEGSFCIFLRLTDSMFYRRTCRAVRFGPIACILFEHKQDRTK